MRRFGWIVPALGVFLVGLWGLVVHAPVYLPPVTPAMLDAQPALDSGPQRVFGYATLTYPPVRLVVLGRLVPADTAQLAGFLRDGRDISPQPDALLDGQVFTLQPAELLRLDRYERLGERYRRDLMTLTDGRTAWVYRLLPEARN